MRSWRKIVQQVIAKGGYQLHKRDAMHSGRKRRALLMREYGIDTVLDVGANQGQYGRELRRDGFKGKIVSFEPLPAVFSALRATTARDDTWNVYNYALGDENERAAINVASNTEWSSFLELSSEYRDAPWGGGVAHDHQQVEVRKLDDVFDDVVDRGASILLKIDAQGYEKKVLEGASMCLGRIFGLQLEMSLQRAYEGEVLFSEMIRAVEEAGFALMSLDPVNVSSETGRIRQVDGLFFRVDEGLDS